MSRLGVEAITGKPYKPTTQGKNERFHQTLFRRLDKQPIAASLAESSQVQVDEFDRIYNTERPQQALPGRVTPRTAWLATPKADPPRPKPERPKPRHTTGEAPIRTTTVVDGKRVLRLRANGSVRLRKVTYMIDGQLAGQDILVIENGDSIIFTDLDGTVLIEHTRPASGIKYVGNGRPRGRRPRTLETSPMS